MSSKSKLNTPSECVQVVIRCRPLSSTEKQNNNQIIVEMNKSHHAVTVNHPSSLSSVKNNNTNIEQPRTFTFDNVFDETTTQQVVYDETCQHIVKSVLTGYNG